MSDELKPCPFCGAVDELEIKHTEGTVLHPHYYVYCDNCGVSDGGSDRGNHITKWNTRAQPSPAYSDGYRAGLEAAANRCQSFSDRPYDVYDECAVAIRALPVPENSAGAKQENIGDNLQKTAEKQGVCGGRKKEAVSVEDVARAIMEAIKEEWPHTANEVCEVDRICAKAAMRALGHKVEG